MSFGWVIAHEDGTVLVQGAGPSHGRGSSLRAEGSGMLAATVFMALVCKFTQRSTMNTRNYSDNQELIRRLIAHQEYDTPFPNETIRAEFDLIEQIYLTTEEANLKTEYGWVRGHQDETTSAENLSIEATLNITCDFLAGNFQKNY